ncbi:hypothetical protein F4821DRAFT_275494 [Hypoxylon rubiginosum]|uniref:Uncharacterized protein n=1 Tax=Hypoxylon rubiginosum TaxID=110542 RepID=A0ACC0CKG9_9PEZI|nr:hypothetical protein F4821DRAFT_275494 [Hypoxylon rubiginosum]
MSFTLTRPYLFLHMQRRDIRSRIDGIPGSWRLYSRPIGELPPTINLVYVKIFRKTSGRQESIDHNLDSPDQVNPYRTVAKMATRRPQYIEAFTSTVIAFVVFLKKIVDDVGDPTIEKCLIQQFPNLLAPEIIYNLTDAEVRRITGKSHKLTAERAHATEKLHVLESIMAKS